jgi:hydrogenase maturation protease
MRHRMLIAGVGNIFLGDDGFGVEAAKRLAAEPLPDWVRVVDFGIRGIHLAYELLDRAYETTILVTPCRAAASRGRCTCSNPISTAPARQARGLPMRMG